jgi:uncharacterized damage-inducible protein DinB
VVDQKPPRLVGGERETLLALLQFQRESLTRKLTGVSEEDADRQFVRSGTTLRWLVQHLAWAESLWIEHRFAGSNPAPVEVAEDSVPAALAAYRATWARVDAVVAAASLDEVCRQVGDAAPVNLRWVLMHLLEETARHAGHADIIRELIDGEAGR